MRSIAFETIRNFRDTGGYAAAEGKKMRAGLVYRSGHFPDASDEDLERLRALRIRTVVDLRRDAERESHPCRFWPGSDARVVARASASQELPPHLAAFQDAGASVEGAMQAMRLIYREMPHDPMLIALYSDYFQAIAEGDGPVLVHCAAGKDRTGLIVALTHHIAGVSAEDAMTDFLLTNEAGLLDAAALLKWRETFGKNGRPVNDDAIRTVMSVVPDYLEAAFESIRDRYGSIDAYLVDALKLSPETKAVIRERLVG